MAEAVVQRGLIRQRDAAQFLDRRHRGGNDALALEDGLEAFLEFLEVLVVAQPCEPGAECLEVAEGEVIDDAHESVEFEQRVLERRRGKQRFPVRRRAGSASCSRSRVREAGVLPRCQAISNTGSVGRFQSLASSCAQKVRLRRACATHVVRHRQIRWRRPTNHPLTGTGCRIICECMIDEDFQFKVEAFIRRHDLSPTTFGLWPPRRPAFGRSL